MRVDLIWFPRIFAIAQVIFMAGLAIDLWGTNSTLLVRAEALLIDLLPALLILLLLLFSWGKPRRGAILFTALGSLYIINEWGHWAAIGFIATPLIVIGLLFWMAFKKASKA